MSRTWICLRRSSSGPSSCPCNASAWSCRPAGRGWPPGGRRSGLHTAPGEAGWTSGSTSRGRTWCGRLSHVSSIRKSSHSLVILITGLFTDICWTRLFIPTPCWTFTVCKFTFPGWRLGGGGRSTGTDKQRSSRTPCARGNTTTSPGKTNSQI